MTPVAGALVPLAILIALGFALRRGAFLPEPSWPSLDRLNYWVLFPALIFVSLATAGRGLENGSAVAFVVWGALLLVSAATLLVRRGLGTDGPGFTSVYQGAVRFNSYVALGALPVLFPGSEGLTALIVAVTVPVVNVTCVLVLARFAGRTPLRGRPLLRSVTSNPLIIASLLGAAVQALAWPLGPLEGALRTLGAASLACGLLSVGATLRFDHVRRGWRPIAASTALKFVALPAATWLIAAWFGLPPSLLAPLVVFQALPTASASFVLARAMGGDEKLMAAILAVQTVVAMAWLPWAYAWTRTWDLTLP
ncbi:MAG: AEC family transporter [bacterium]|nr:AEC family transporter [bacterium]